MSKVLAAIVVPPHLSVSGGARAAELLSGALADHCDITIASMMKDTGPPAGKSGRTATRIPVQTWLPPLVPWSRLSNRYSTLFYRSTIPDIVRHGDYDLVHIHNPMPALEMERVARACEARNIPYVVSTHGFNEVANGDRIYGFDTLKKIVWSKLVEKPVSRVVSGASGVFALSPADFGIVRSMGFRGSELTVVSNGVTASVPIPVDRSAAALKRLGVSSKKNPAQIACMFLGNHTPNKGLPILLEAFSEVDRPFLLIVGGEKRSDINYDRYIGKLRPGQEIIVTGRLTDDEVQALLYRSDLFVFPTLADTFPLVVLEAMERGVPVLASRVGGIPYQLDQECGVLIEPQDVAGLRQAINELAGQPARLAEMGKRARTRVTSKFTWAKAARDAASSYKRVLALHAEATANAVARRADGAEASWCTHA